MNKSENKWVRFLLKKRNFICAIERKLTFWEHKRLLIFTYLLDISSFPSYGKEGNVHINFLKSFFGKKDKKLENIVNEILSEIRKENENE